MYILVTQACLSLRPCDLMSFESSLALNDKYKCSDAFLKSVLVLILLNLILSANLILADVVKNTLTAPPDRIINQ